MRSILFINLFVLKRVGAWFWPDDSSWEDAKNQELHTLQGSEPSDENSKFRMEKDALAKKRLDHLRRSTSRLRQYIVPGEAAREEPAETTINEPPEPLDTKDPMSGNEEPERAESLDTRHLMSGKEESMDTATAGSMASAETAANAPASQSVESAEDVAAIEPNGRDKSFSDALSESIGADNSWEGRRSEELRALRSGHSLQDEGAVDAMKHELRTIKRLRHLRDNVERLRHNAEGQDNVEGLRDNAGSQDQNDFDFFSWMEAERAAGDDDPDQELMKEIDRTRAKLCGGSKRLASAPLDHKQCTKFMDDRCRSQDKTTGEGWCKKWKKLAAKACKEQADRDICKGYIDTDGDHVVDVDDAFPKDPKEWDDTDKDGVGDNADACPQDPDEQKDTDGDGVCDNSDAFPEDPKEQKDTDGDGVGDNKDAFPKDPKEQKDTDGDGVGDNSDAFPEDPKEQKDSDGDGFGDNSDAFPEDPKEHLDTDGDGVGDNADGCPEDPKGHKDTDGDKVCDYVDAFPEDPKEQKDTDGDGVGDNGDAFPEDPKEQKDTDGDGVGDNGDACPEDPHDHKDSDGDGVCDHSDAFPEDPKEQKDTDGDGIGDNADAFPEDPKEWADCGNDGIGDNADKDCDGVVNEKDAFPNDGKEWEDTDGDGKGNNGDAYPNNKECFNASLPCGTPEPPPPPKWPESSNQKKEDRMYPAQGYGEYSYGGTPVSGDWVEHDDQKTATADWRSEWPKKDETEHASISKICEEHPDNDWCNRYHKKAAAEKTDATSSWFR